MYVWIKPEKISKYACKNGVAINPITPTGNKSLIKVYTSIVIIVPARIFPNKRIVKDKRRDLHPATWNWCTVYVGHRQLNHGCLCSIINTCNYCTYYTFCQKYSGETSKEIGICMLKWKIYTKRNKQYKYRSSTNYKWRKTRDYNILNGNYTKSRNIWVYFKF